MANIDVIINVDVTSSVNEILKKFNTLVDDTTMLEIYNLWGKMIEPWVPMDSGILAHSYQITPEYLKYPGPYTHYQYIGIVYGPNFPGWEDGSTPGWRSPRGKGSKHPTGRELGKDSTAVLTPVWERQPDGTYKHADPNKQIVWDFGYNKEHHPNAAHHWDKVAWPIIKDKFLQGVRDILLRRTKDLYGY